MSVKTSVIIPTLNRPKSLKIMLESLLNQTLLPDEVIIVDQGKNDESKKMSHELLGNYTGHNPLRNFLLKYIQDADITGAAQARNRGIDVATGDIIFLFDDDVVLDSGYIKEVLRVYADNRDVAGVGGIIVNYNFSKRKKVKIFNSIFLRNLFKDDRQDIYGKYAAYEKPIITNKLSGGCASYRRAVLTSEYFDETFDAMFDRYSFGEDIDLSLRISKKHKLMINPRARITHILDEPAKMRKHRNSVVYFESASWTYIFNAHMEKNLSNFSSYCWICIGWFLRALRSLLRLDYVPAKSLIQGIRRGRAFSKAR